MPGNVSSVLRWLRTALTSPTESLGSFLSSFGSTGFSLGQASQARDCMNQLQAEQTELLRRHNMAKQTNQQATPISKEEKLNQVKHAAERARSAMETYLLHPSYTNMSAAHGLSYEYQAYWIEAHA